MVFLRVATIALNVAFTALATVIVTKLASAWQNHTRRVENAVAKSKEAASAAKQTADSLKEVADAYEELGDKSKWDSDANNQAKDLQEQILDILKEQNGISKDKIDKIDLQNGKYEDQLKLLRQIRFEQLQSEESTLIQNKDDQGKMLVKTAKEEANDVHSVDSFDSDMAKELSDRFGWSYNADTGVLNFGNYDQDNPESIVRHYNEIGQALDIITKKYNSAERAASGLYEAFKNDYAGLKDQVDAYQEASDSLKETSEEVGKYKLFNDLEDGKKINLSHDEIDEKVKATKQYKDAVEEAKETEKEWAAGGYAKYGNIDNFHRDKIDWTAENRKKYAAFAEENPDDVAGGYSTVLGSSTELDGHEVAYTPMLQTDNGLVPLTHGQIDKYLKDVFEASYNDKGELDLDKLMEIDATGLEENINGVLTQVKGMIAGVEGGKGSNGKTLTKADIWAMAGSSNDEIAQAMYGGEIGDYSGMGWLSRYVGKSMHDAQATAQEGKDKVEAVYQELYDDLENQNGQRQGSDSKNIRFFDHLENAFHTLAESLGKNPEDMKISDVLGLTADGVELTDEQAQAVDTLSAAAGRYGTTIQAVAEAGEENGMFGGIEDAENRIAQTAKDMETLSQQIDNIQKAYKSCSTAVDEYNKYGYMSADSLQSLLSMDYEYLSCMELVNGKLQLNNEAFAQMVASKYADAKVTAVQNAIAQIQAITQDSVKESTGGATDAMGEQVNKLNELSPGLGDAIKGTVGLAAAQELLNAAEEKSTVDPNRVQTILDGLNTQLSVIDSTIDTILGDSSKIKNHLNGFDKNKNKGSSASKSVTDVASAFDTLTKAMKEYNQYGYISADTMKSLMKLEDKFTSCLVKNGDKLEVNANAFRKLVEEQLKKEAETGKDTKSTAELNRILGYLDKNVHSATISFEQLTDVIKGYGSAMDEAKEKTDSIKSAFSDLAEVSQNKIDNPFGLLDSDDVEKKYQAIRDLYDNTDLFTNDKYAGALNPETGDIDYNSDAFKDMFLDNLDKMITACKETGGAAGEHLAKGFEDAKQKIASNALSIEDYINGIGSTLSKINNSMDDYQSAFNDLSDIIDEYNAYGELSQDTIQKYMSLNPKYAACLEEEGGKLVFNKEAFRDLYVEQLKVLAETYKGTDLGDRYAEILEKVANGTWDVTDQMKGMGTEARKLQSIISDLKDLFSSMVGIFEKFNSNKSNDLKIWGEAMTEEIDKRIEALQEQNDEQERAIELAKLQAELEKAQTQKTVRVYTSNGYEWQTDESAIKEARDNLSEKQRQWALDDEVDKLNKLKDKYSEIINLIGSDWDDHQKKLQYTAQIQNMTFDQMSAGLDGFKNNVVANMKQVATATTMTTVISNLTSLIDTLVKLNKVITEIETGSTTDSGLAGLFNRIGKLFGGSSEDGTSNGGFFSKIGSFLSNAWNTVTGKTTTDGAQSSGNLFTNLWNVFTKSTDGAEKKGIFSGFTNAIKNFFFGGGTEGSTGGLVGLIKSGFGTVTSMVTNGVSSLASQSGILGTVGNALMSFGKGIAGVIGGSSGIAGIVSGALSKIPVIGPILLGGTIAVSAIGGGSVTNGLKKIGSGIVDAIKNIGAVIGGAIKSLGTFIFGGTDSSGEKKRGLLGTVFDVVTAPVRWVGSLLGFAKGTTSVSEDGIYNVDEKGEEIIVRAPQQGRATTLSKGDGVIPADITKNLMEIGKNPTGWISKLITKKKTGSSRNENASSGTTKEFLGSITGSPERLKGLVDEIVDVFGFDEIDLTKLKSAKTKGDILSIVKDLANGQMERLRSKFDKVWEKSIEGTGITKAQVDSIGGTIFDRMSAMISNTMDSALNNKDISDNDIKNICADLFQRMGYIYENGWDNLYSLSPDMPEDVSKKLHDSFDIINDKYLSDVDSINEVLGGKIGKVQDSMNVTESSGGSYNGNSMDANIGGEPLLNLSKIKENVKNLFEKFSNSKLGSWLSEHSLGSTIDKLSKYSSSSDPNVLQKALHLFSHPSELAKTVVESTIRAISGTKDTVEWAVKNPDKVAESVEKVAKSAYNSGKKIVNDIEYAVTHPKETFDKIVDNVGKAIDSGINFVKDNLGKLTGKKATGARSINKAGTYNVDERGSELLVRQPQSGRYTYLETGDGVVPADITSRLFEMGGNPDAWFQDQLRKTGLTTNIQSRDTGSSISIGDIYVQQPIGDVDSLARAINNELPNAILQQRRKR